QPGPIRNAILGSERSVSPLKMPCRYRTERGYALKMKRFCAQVLLGFGLFVIPVGAAITLSNDGYHVFPGDNIQDALQLAAENKTNKTVKVHAGEYRPKSKRQALIWFTKINDR